jgi:hypothetical protein
VVSEVIPAPFLIMGCPRSGTTLVAQLLDNHSRLAVFIETLYYPLFRADLHRYGDLNRPRNLRRLLANLEEMVLLHQLHRVPPPSAREMEAALPEPSFEAVLATFLHLYALRSGKARCGEKTAGHHEYLAEIRARMPQSPVAFLMRDPRDVAESTRRMFGVPLEAAGEQWNRAWRNYRRCSRGVHLVRYEALVADPAAALRPLLDALGESFEAPMLDFFRRLPDRLRAAPHHTKLSSPVDANHAGRFRGMPEAEVALVETVCAEGMEAMGYAFQARGRRTAVAPRRVGRLFLAATRLRRILARPQLAHLSWRRWRMRVLVRLRYLLTLGPLRARASS